MNNRAKQYSNLWLPLIVLAGLATGSLSQADTRVAVLDFELNDLTGITPIPHEELERTATLAPLLRESLGQKGYTVIMIRPEEQRRANSGFGYLYDHPDEAASLGQRFGADAVVVGLIHKPSFLFAYLKTRLVSPTAPLGESVVEIKGSAKKVTERGIRNLAHQIDRILQQGQREIGTVTPPTGE